MASLVKTLNTGNNGIIHIYDQKAIRVSRKNVHLYYHPVNANRLN